MASRVFDDSYPSAELDVKWPPMIPLPYESPAAPPSERDRLSKRECRHDDAVKLAFDVLRRRSNSTHRDVTDPTPWPAMRTPETGYVSALHNLCDTYGWDK